MPKEAAALVERAMSESRLEFKVRGSKTSVPSTQPTPTSTPRPEMRIIDGIGEISLKEFLAIFTRSK